MSSRVRYAFAAAVPVVLACASGPPLDEALRPRSDVVTRAELRETGATNAYEAIQRLRPRWLVVRSGTRSFSMETMGTEVVVFQDQLLLGNQDALRRMGIEGIYAIRYLDGSTAKATLPRLGDRRVQGAIVVYLSPPPPD
jgi:hypothetical protein